MTFAPSPTPRGYSYVEDAPRYIREETNKRSGSNADKYFRHSDEAAYDAAAAAVKRAVLGQVLDSKYARRSTLIVQEGLQLVYQTKPGRSLINKVASVSLNKSVQGAAAISHVSKIIRTHGITNVGAMVVNDGRLLYKYCKSDISGAEAVNGVFSEFVGMGGDMAGWMMGASLAASFLLPPYGAAVATMFGSMAGRAVGQWLARALTKG